jgi:hypothetical protein
MQLFGFCAAFDRSRRKAMQTRLQTAPLVGRFIDQLIDAERAERIATHSATDVRLCDDGQLQVGGERYPLGEKARYDLARIAAIPAQFFWEVDGDLRATLFKRRIATHGPANGTVDIIWKNSAVVHVRPSTRLNTIPRSEILTTIAEQAPPAVISNDIRAITYALNGRVDLALVTEALTTVPRPGDIVYGGVHLTIEENGATQIGPALFRLICSNGAMSRICWKGHHRIRRGDGKDSRGRLLGTISKFAGESWNSWHEVAGSLAPLATRRLDDLDSLIARLSGRPFFISEAAARLVREILDQQIANGETLTHYDLWNAITSVGTHGDILPRYSYRLRLGAGALARGRVGVCAQCRQFILIDS